MADFTSLSIVLAANPPLLCQREVFLEVVQQVGARHGATGEEMCAHPPVLEIIRSGFVSEDVHKELPSRFQ